MSPQAHQVKSIDTVIRAQPRGYCAGVSRAVKTTELCVTHMDQPVYIKHQIVHNKTVTDALKKQGARTVEHIEDVPDGAVVIFSAHGSPPEDFEKALEKGCTVIDATCPYVIKVHQEMKRYLGNGYTVVYIGKKKHVEAIGVCAEGRGHEDRIVHIETEQEAEHVSFPPDTKVVCLTQTTLHVGYTDKLIAILKKRTPQLESPPVQDICYATTNRQRAVSEIARQADLVLVIGSANSSNSVRLVEVAKEEGVPAYLIDSIDDAKGEWFENVRVVGLTAGASAPEYLIEKACDYFKEVFDASVETSHVEDETLSFQLPSVLKELIKSTK